MQTTVLLEHILDVRRVFVGGYSWRGLLSQVRATPLRVVLAVVSLMVNRGTDTQMGRGPYVLFAVGPSRLMSPAVRPCRGRSLGCGSGFHSGCGYGCRDQGCGCGRAQGLHWCASSCSS